MTPACRTCGGAVLFGNLYCSKLCGQQMKVHAADIVAAGFVQDSDVPNVFRKDGVAITTEQVMHVGLDKALQLHAHATDAHRA